MKATHLELTNFRNYRQQELDFGDGVNIIFGDNAQGKTNILEAVYFFSMGKSNRARRDAELIMHGEESAKIVLGFTDRNRDNIAEAELFRDKRKSIAVNEIPIRKNSELVRRFTAVYFWTRISWACQGRSERKTKKSRHSDKSDKTGVSCRAR